MHTQRFFVNAESIDTEHSLVKICEPGLIIQIQKVLRLRSGDQIFILDGSGFIYSCTLEKMKSEILEARIESKERSTGQPKVNVTIFMPLLRGGRFEWALEKLTELGASKIIPIVYARSVAKSTSTSKLNHWHMILKEAAEQCERPAIPQIVEPLNFPEALKAYFGTTGDPSHIYIMCAERTQSQPLLDFALSLDTIHQAPPNISLIVGPEGGFTTQEFDLVSPLGITLVSLGSRILRSETAAVSALTQIISVLDRP